MRIIAGTARGRVFVAPDGVNTRPTLDRVREALFSMLQFRIADARVLDLFSGSGALGLEAASRGAQAVFCNDHDRKCAALIAKNAQSVGLAEKITVSASDFKAALERLHSRNESFDLVFLDAPYASDYARQACQLLVKHNMLRDGAVIAAEHSAAIPWRDVDGLRVIKTKRYGECVLTLCEYITEKRAWV